MRTKLALSACTAIAAGQAYAADPGSFLLWQEDPAVSYAELDIDPTTTAVEWVVVGESLDTVGVGGEQVETTFAVQFKVRSPDGKSNVASLSRSANVSTGPYPDPVDGFFNGYCYASVSTTRFYCPFSGESASSARENVEDSIDPPLGFGIADTDSGAVFIVGVGAAVEVLGGEEDDIIGNFNVFSYDADSLNYNCKIKLPIIDGSGYEVDFAISSVGNYLSSGGRGSQDEIRIVSQNPDDRWKLKFYDPADCSVISATTTKAPTP